MLRWSMLLATALGLVAISMSGLVWLKQATRHAQEDIRQARIQQQTLEQQLHLLQSSGNQSTLAGLQEDLAAVQIRLVEVLTRKPLPSGVLDIAYEQRVLPQPLSDPAGAPVHILRLDLKLLLKHSVALLELLAHIDESVTVWPYETRGCALHRLPDQQLNVQCVLDFYHWGNPAPQESSRSGAAGITVVDRA
jgi:hypothetical protein